jgi:OPA family glycerol-3-phosphate transporter-like MFS transporter 1/2
MTDSEAWTYYAPWGYRLLERCTRGGRGLSLRTNRTLVLVLTFLCYAAYHASRKPPSIVKSVLHGDGGPGDRRRALIEAVQHRGFVEVGRRALAAGGGLAKGKGRHRPAGNGTLPSVDGDGWAPFNNAKAGKSLLGDLDLAFLGSYAVGMFVSGHLGDRVDLRHFLTGGMLGSGLCVVLFGCAYFWGLHAMAYFVAVQVVGGALQASGWPSVVSVMANWFGKGKRGLIMGIWNAHTSVGNIVGSLVAAYCLRWGWGWSFVAPGALIIGVGLLIFSLLVVEPQDIGFLPQSGSNLGSLVSIFCCLFACWLVWCCGGGWAAHPRPGVARRQRGAQRRRARRGRGRTAGVCLHAERPCRAWCAPLLSCCRPPPRR